MVSLLTVGLAVANPGPITWPTAPLLDDKPTIVIETPANNSITSNSTIDLNFTVANPDSWTKESGFGSITYPLGGISNITVFLDGNLVFCTNPPNINLSEAHVWGTNPAHYSIPIQPSQGQHVLNLTVLAYSYYSGPAYNGSHIAAPEFRGSSRPVYQYPIVVSQTADFSVEQTSPPNQDTNVTPIQPATWILIAVVLVSVVTVVAFLSFGIKKSKVQ
jgi:hypothetical protein